MGVAHPYWQMGKLQHPVLGGGTANSSPVKVSYTVQLLRTCFKQLVIQHGGAHYSHIILPAATGTGKLVPSHYRAPPGT